MTTALQETLIRAANRSRQMPARWTVCIMGPRRQVLARLVLGRHEEVAELALRLERMGFGLDADDPDPCDFVFVPLDGSR